jgi:hypothetical protein
MKKSNLLSIIFCFLLIQALCIAPSKRVYAESSTTKSKVYILAGQSNMAGIGMNHELSSEYLGVQEKVKIYAEGTVDDSLKGVWSPLCPGFGGGSGCFGPELTFGRDISAAYPDSQIFLIKCGWSGTNLQADWRPPSAGGTTGPLYKNLVQTVNGALAALDKNIDYELAGMCWMQGESDACSIYPANDYEDNLTAFINDVRKEFNAPTLPFVIAMIDDSDVWAENAIVRQAEINISKNVPNVGIFDTKDYDTDGTHYRTQGILDMGSDFAKTILSMTSTTTPDKFIYGDVDGNGSFNGIDFAGLRKYLLGMIDGFTYSDWKKAGDVNGDGNINAIDFGHMRNRLLGIIDKFPIEE